MKIYNLEPSMGQWERDKNGNVELGLRVNFDFQVDGEDENFGYIRYVKNKPSDAWTVDMAVWGSKHWSRHQNDAHILRGFVQRMSDSMRNKLRLQLVFISEPVYDPDPVDMMNVLADMFC